MNMMMMHRRRRRRAHWMLLLFCSCLLAFPSHGPLPVEAFVGAYGINYGRIANNIPSPDKVAALLRASKIRNVKIYDADHSVLDAFKGRFELGVGLYTIWLQLFLSIFIFIALVTYRISHLY